MKGVNLGSNNTFFVFLNKPFEKLYPGDQNIKKKNPCKRTRYSGYHIQNIMMTCINGGAPYTHHYNREKYIDKA